MSSLFCYMCRDDLSEKKCLIPLKPVVLCVQPKKVNLKATRNLLNDIDLIVYDMAGTTVQDCVDKDAWEWSRM